MLGSDRFTFETPNVIDPGDLPPSQPPRLQRSASEQVNHNNLNSPEEKKADSMDEGSPLRGGGGGMDDYQEARSARLLKDIGDLELTPTRSAAVPYDPYDDDDDGDDDDDEEAPTGRRDRRIRNSRRNSSSRNASHSLPTAEEARLYANCLLNSDTLGGPSAATAVGNKSPLPRGIPIDSLSARSLLQQQQFGRKHQQNQPCGRCWLWCNTARAQLLQSCPFSRAVWLRILAVSVVLIFIVVGGTAIASKKRQHNSSSVAPPSSSTSSQSTMTTTSGNPRLDSIVQFLSDNGISRIEDLTKTGTPQYKAAYWMASKDVLMVDVPESLHSNQRFVQRFVLVTLYYATNGEDQWKQSYNFLSDQDECAWFDKKELIDFVAQRTAFGVTCNYDLQVRALFLPKNGMKGSLPSELQFLTALDMLGFGYNALQGGIPDGLRSLTDLSYLDLKYNMMSGSLPQWLGDMDELEVLGLSNNNFAGSIPDSFGTLAGLKTLAIDDNAFTGSINFVNHLFNLEYFFADRNLLTGKIDQFFMSSLQKLRQVDISFNNLQADTFPVHLLQHPRLSVLDLADNSITGPLPELEEENNVLSFLSLRRMGLTGSIPNSLHNLKQLTHLDLFGNQFSSVIPNALGTLTNLNYLFLGENPFDSVADFPPLFSQLSLLRELSLASTSIGGTIPSWLRYLQELKLLDLSGNDFVGEIPSSIWNLPQLTYLLVNDNDELTGSIPTNIASPEKFQIVSLYHTGLVGDVNYICQANADMDLMATDCDTVTCSKDCCPECCANNADSQCFVGKVSTYMTWYEGMWEFNFTRQSYSFDPAILSNSAVITIIQEEPDDVRSGELPSSGFGDLPTDDYLPELPAGIDVPSDIP